MAHGARETKSRRRTRALFVVAPLLALGACADAYSRERHDEAGSTATLAQTLTKADYTGAGLGANELVLTFDDGPGPRTSELSSYLKAEGIRATFFVNGACIGTTTLPHPGCSAPVANAGAILAQITADGHLLANHTTTHRSLTGASSTPVVPKAQLEQELAETDVWIAPFTPDGRRLFRAPYGDWGASVFEVLQSTSMRKYVGPIGWDIGGVSDAYPGKAADWACWQGQLTRADGKPANGAGYATTTQCGDAYFAEIAAANHGIVLMHDPYAWAHGSTVDMVKYLVPKLKATGYRFVALDEVPSIAATLRQNGADAACAPHDPDAACEVDASSPDATSNLDATSSPDATSCDDGDPCTKDAYDPASGCSHEPIAGCPRSGPAPSSSTSTTPAVPPSNAGPSSAVGSETIFDDPPHRQEPPSTVEPGSGCSASRVAYASPSPWLALSAWLALVGLAAVRRARARHAASS